MADLGVLGQFPEALKDALKSGNAQLIAEKVREYLEKQKKIPLNIAVTGVTGSGKSTFINAFRGVDNRDENAAATGCVETTFKVQCYKHPNFPNVTLWDLPGIGSPTFQADKYLEKVDFKTFDFFIIISADRFRENDVKLALEIQKMGKKFYFVRTKIDHNIRDEERSQRNFSPEKTLDRIRKNAIEGLQNLRIKSPKVFLISSFDLQLYDFQELCKTLEDELPQHQRHVLLLALPNVSQGIIDKKKEVLQAKIPLLTALSAVGALLPLPGTSLAIDGTIIVKFLTECQEVFQVDAVKLLHSLLNEEMQPGKEMTVRLVLRVLSASTYFVSLMAAEEGIRFIPIIGIPLAASLSSVTTYEALKYFLEKFADAAQKANMMAVEHFIKLRTEVQADHLICAEKRSELLAQSSVK